MLRAIVEDVHDSGEDVVVMLDERVPFDLPGRVIRVNATKEESARDTFDQAIADVDATLVIAPEHDGLLTAAIERVESTGVLNLGSSSEAIRACRSCRSLPAASSTAARSAPVVCAA